MHRARVVSPRSTAGVMVCDRAPPVDVAAPPDVFVARVFVADVWLVDAWLLTEVVPPAGAVAGAVDEEVFELPPHAVTSRPTRTVAVKSWVRMGAAL